MADIAAIARYDAATFGADRAHVLRHLVQRAPGLAFVAEEAGALRGFVLGRDGREATQIGPLMADNPAVAIELVDAALARVSGRVYVDSLDRHRELNAHLAMRGFDIQRGFTRMLLGRSTRLRRSRPDFCDRRARAGVTQMKRGGPGPPLL